MKIAESKGMDQSELISIIAQKPNNFAWFLGAGTSRMSGLPTATDLIWDLKVRHYCKSENQDISDIDIRSEVTRNILQQYFDSRGFPAEWAPEEYSLYFEKIFGDDKQRQRRYIAAMLDEKKVKLTVGNRALAALLATGMAKIVFTTNFDTVVEKSMAEINGSSLSAYHLEASANAIDAFNNEEFPFYCKIHGDFRYDSIKNLSSDLVSQDKELSKCLIASAARYGLIVLGYSGRDESVMRLLNSALDIPNAFPNGLYWCGLKGSEPPPVVQALLNKANTNNVKSGYVGIETFDTFMLKLWRNIPAKPQELNAKVQKATLQVVDISREPGTKMPVIRFNALPIVGMPEACGELVVNRSVEWQEIRDISRSVERKLILTKQRQLLFWGGADLALKAVPGASVSNKFDVRPLLKAMNDNLFMKPFLEEALCLSFVNDKALLFRSDSHGATIIINKDAVSVGDYEAVTGVTGKPHGIIPGLFTEPTPEHPEREKIAWAECVKLSIDLKDGQHWLTLDPDIWIWPPRARKQAREFLDGRRSDRKNGKYNQLITAWVQTLLGTDQQNTVVSFSPFQDGDATENPVFQISTRTGFARGSD